MRVLPRKTPPSRKHFFEWLKTAISSNACGTSTLKSLLSQAFSVPDVHPRLRKYLARCTLDCGFKTPESPALRGFVAERGPITGTSLYLVLKSNGLRHSKNPPVKFGFSSKTVPANIAQKLPSQRCPKPLFIALFNFSHKRPTFAFTSESGYTLGFRRKIAHKGTHGETGGVLGGGWYHYPRSVPHVSETLRGQGVERQTLPLLGLGRVYARRTQKACGTAMRLCVSLSRRRRGPAGLRDPVAIVSMIKNMINPWAGSFLIFCWANANSIKKVVLLRRNSCAAGDVLFSYSGAIFGRSRSPFH